MSDWPKRYDFDGRMLPVEQGDFVSFKDFQSILYFCAGYISCTPRFETTHPEEVAKWLLKEYKKGGSNE